MNTATFNGFRDLVYEACGISLGDQKKALVCARVAKRMRALGMNDYDSYLSHVKRDHDDGELVHLLDAISTNVTSFFREADHFDLVRDLLLQWSAKGQNRFRIWSAACSTGEEPYTLAMTAQEALGSGCQDLKILATDISTKVLVHSQEGAYNGDKLSPVPPNLRARYFEKAGDGATAQYRVKESAKSLVTFRRLNLATPPFPMRGPLDIIFCRNVMIYFDNDVRRRLLAEMYRLLKPGGYLMVGHAESLTGMVSDFKSVRPSTYLKP
jgi:chemotaxis protein methyltransferase CheR